MSYPRFLLNGARYAYQHATFPAAYDCGAQRLRQLQASYETLASVLVPLGCACLVSWSVLGHGLPALRHDWWFPLTSSAMHEVISWYSSGWSAYGLGSAQPYPTFYPLVPVLAALSYILPPLGVLICLIAATTYCLARTGMKLGSIAGVGIPGQVALALVATLNPWVYTEFVCGHPYMIAAYAIMLSLTAETLRPNSRNWALVILSALSIVQIEFFLIAIVPFATWCVRGQKKLALVIFATFAAPIAFGLAANYSLLKGTPYGLDWEQWESIPFFAGALLRGYGLRYDVAFQSIAFASIMLALLSIYGCWIARNRPAQRTIILISLACILYATGSTGILAPLYNWLVIHVPESAVFRELYDLIAIACIGTVLALSLAFARSKLAAIVGCIAALTFLYPWIKAPILKTVVSAASLPRVVFEKNESFRVALLPAFQPMSFSGAGSGTDPNAFIEPGFATPLNEWFPSFPVDMALAFAERDHDFKYIAALGVRTIINRPYLHSDDAALLGQGIKLNTAPQSLPLTTNLANALPILTLHREAPLVTSIGNQSNENSIFFGDIYPDKITTFHPSTATHDQRLTWVDARLSFISHPENASAFGGVMTSSRVPLVLDSRGFVLARAAGRIMDEHGAIVVPFSDNLHWWKVPANTHVLVCDGECIVVLQADVPPNLAEHHIESTQPITAIPIHHLTDWAATASVPADTGGTLRYNIRYDKYWLALSGLRQLQHFRLNTALNAWFLPSAPYARNIILVNASACIQALLELLAFGTLAIALVVSLRSGDTNMERKNVHE
jgi:hypothetical protein